MKLSFLIFTEIAKLNTCEMFSNRQIAKLNTRKTYFFSNCEIKYPRNLIPSEGDLMQIIVKSKINLGLVSRPIPHLEVKI